MRHLAARIAKRWAMKLNRQGGFKPSRPKLTMKTLILAIAILPLTSCHAQEFPGARDHVGLAYDLPRDRIVLFGGSAVDSAGSYISNPTTWEWDGLTWEKVDDGFPGGITSMSMLFDGASNRVITMGGIDPARGDLSETWQWNGTDWILLQASTPGARLSPAMTYDPIRQEVVLFSGCVGRSYPSDTWIFKNNQWSRVSEDGPKGVCRASLFYDQVRGNVVLFGGALDSGGQTNELWEWDGQSWSPVDQGETIPSPRSNVIMAYDENRKRGILYGGRVEGQVSDELWEWDGNAWLQVPKQPIWPGPREVYGLVYHNVLQEVLLYGGRSEFAKPYADFWSWDGRIWNRIH